MSSKPGSEAIGELVAEREATFERYMTLAREGDVSTPPNSLVLFSISRLPTTENKDNAFEHVAKTPGAMMIDHTETGRQLEDADLFGEASQITYEQASAIWHEASRRLIEEAKGDVRAFVENAHELSTFRSIELPTLLANDDVPTINGVDKWEFEPLASGHPEWFADAKARHDAGADKGPAASGARVTGPATRP